MGHTNKEQTTSYGGIGKTTQEMKTKSTFTNAGWNFDFIWDISTAFPIIDIDTTYRPSDTDADGYLNISTLTDLLWLSESGFDLDSDWEMDNDINAADTKNWNGTLGFSPIGINSLISFSGEFEGHGYKIDSIYINRPSQSNVGFFGYINRAEISNFGVVNCDISGENVVGGLVGYSFISTVSNSYSTGSVSGGNYIGGLAGANTKSSSIIESYSICSVSGSNQVGGLVGGNTKSTVSNSYSRGSVSGTEQVGGLVGYNYISKVINSYSTGSVEGTGFWVGGIVGVNSLSETGDYFVVYSFWDTQTSGQTTSDGGKGKSTAEMKTKSTFTDAGWDFENIWTIDGTTNDGYPYFRDVNTGILERETIPDKNIFVYPNPASDYIEITINKPTGPDFIGAKGSEIEIYDVLGDKVLSVETRHTLSLQRIDISHLPRGVYFVRVGNNVEKFVKN